jgi:hypothetical protein
VSRIEFDTPDALADDLAGFFGLSRAELRDKLTERNWHRVALIYSRLLDLIEEGAIYFARAWRIRQNPEWAPDRPIRAELKLSRINEKVSRVERQIFDALKIDPPPFTGTGGAHSD